MYYVLTNQKKPPTPDPIIEYVYDDEGNVIDEIVTQPPEPELPPVELVKYPYTVGMLRKDNPLTSFPKQINESTLNDFGVFKVVDVKPEITAAQKLAKPSQPVYQNGQWQLIWTAEDKTLEEVEAELSQAKSNKLSQLHQSCDNDLKQLATGYPERETQTWAVQLEEAKAYLSDPTSPAPFISAALKQGETVEQYAQLIVANNAAWSDYAGKVVLKRRTYETLINSAQTVEEINSINWEVQP